MTAERRVAIVSGGSRGLGQGIVADLLRSDAIVATFSRSTTPFIDQQRDADPQAESFLWEELDGAESDTGEDYRRALDLTDAVARVAFRRAGVEHRREMFVSHPDRVLVLRWTADQAGAVSGTLELKGAHGEVTRGDGPSLSFDGVLENGLRYKALARVITRGGSAVIHVTAPPSLIRARTVYKPSGSICAGSYSTANAIGGCLPCVSMRCVPRSVARDTS